MLKLQARERQKKVWNMLSLIESVAILVGAFLFPEGSFERVRTVNTQTTRLALQPGIKEVPQRITEHVYAIHHNRQTKTGP